MMKIKVRYRATAVSLSRVISQCPPLGGPMRRSIPFSFSLFIYSFVAVIPFPVCCANCGMVIMLLPDTISMMSCSGGDVFRSLFRSLYTGTIFFYQANIFYHLSNLPVSGRRNIIIRKKLFYRDILWHSWIIKDDMMGKNLYQRVCRRSVIPMNDHIQNQLSYTIQRILPALNVFNLVARYYKFFI